MADHPNAQRVRETFEAFAARDLDKVRESFAPDVLWHQPGNNPLSGDFKGADEVLALFARVFELAGGTFVTEVHDVVGNDTHAVALIEISAERDGKRLDQRAVNVFHVDPDGKITERWLYLEDQAAADDFWS